MSIRASLLEIPVSVGIKRGKLFHNPVLQKTTALFYFSKMLMLRDFQAFHLFGMPIAIIIVERFEETAQSQRRLEMKNLVVIVMALCLPVIANAAVVPFDASAASGSLAATAQFSQSGSNLQVVLTNTSTADVLIPSQLLTALFFSINQGTLTPVSAILTAGSTVFFDSAPAGGVVGGEWAYGSGLSGAPLGATSGISSAGVGLFGPTDNFPGANLDGPVSVNGLNYGITSAGDNPAIGNAAVTGNVPLIENSVTFLLGYSGIFADLDITKVSFQYGTALTDTNLPNGPPEVPVPEPGTMMLLGSGLVGLAGWGRKKFRK